MPTLISGSTGVNKITDGTIVNADINASAAIAGSKISGSFGKVLQVVSVISDTAVTVSTTSYTDISMSVAITPAATSSKILVIADLAATVYNNSASCVGQAQIVRTSTALSAKRFGYYANDAGTDNNWYAGVNMSYLDSPSTTSATTYKIQAKAYGATSVTTESGGANGTSTLTLMEIAG